MRSALITAALLALVLCGCGSEQTEVVKNQIADMESELSGMENELTEVKAMVGDLKAELSNCKDELQAITEQKLQEAKGMAEDMLEEAPAPPEHPTSKIPDHPTGDTE